MCGIAGFTGNARPDLMTRMIDAVVDRGPDGSGSYSSDRVHFGHTRLAILDLAGGGQPMSRGNGNVTICYNGEIYNYDELRAEIERAGYVPKTACDTELIPLGYLAFGEKLFDKLNGMFAFALYDRTRQKLFLVRDQLGIKPLFFGTIGSDIVFSSSARAVALHPDIDRSLNSDALREFVQYRYIKSNIHFFRGVESLPPGTFLEWSPTGVRRQRFWQPQRRQSATDSRSANEESLVEGINELIENSVRRQLRSDVPLGVFLSGGVDSSLIAHFAARHSSTRLTAFTFSIGDAADEVKSARKAAQFHQMNHRTVRLQSADFNDFPKAIASMDSPVGDAIVLPTFKLCQAASQEVKVVLTGEGADEFFGGYVHFPVLRKLGVWSERLPALKLLSPIVRRLPVSLLDRMFTYQSSLGTLGRSRVADMIRAIGDTGKLAALANQVIDDRDLAEGTNLATVNSRPAEDLTLAGQMLTSTQTWLPNQILHKMDQLSMAHGLEARVPYVDHRLYDFLLQAPDSLFHDGKRDKIALRGAAGRQNLAASERAKVAFHLPIERMWHREFNALCDAWLSDEIIRKYQIIRRQFVRDCRKQADAGEFMAAKKLITLASLNMWLEANEIP